MQTLKAMDACLCQTPTSHKACQRRRDDEKIISERSSQKGGRQGVRKEGQQGTQLEILLSA